MDIKGRVVVITGASRGIGKAIADAMSVQGAIVIGCDSRSVDVRDSTTVKSWIDKIITEHGHIDVLINSAAVTHKFLPAEDISPEECEKVINVNVCGTFNCLHAVLPLMKKRKEGCIINIASRAWCRPAAFMSVYAASKYAVVGLTRAIAKELTETCPSVFCFSVSPSGVHTDMRAELFGEEDSAAQQSPENVAGHIIEVITGVVSVENGSDVQIANGEISEIVSM